MTTVHLRKISVRILSLILCILSAGVVAISCRSNNDEPKKVERPSLEFSNLTIPLGTVQVVEVQNARDVRADHVPPFLEINECGNKMEILGKSIGIGDVNIRADGYLLKLKVEVIDVPVDSGTEELPDDLDKQLEDQSIRMEYGDLLMRYDTPGNLFAISSDHCVAIAQSLVTGTTIRFSSDMPFMDFSGDNLPHTITSPSLTINDESVELKRAVVLKATRDRIWLACMPRLNRNCLWFVLKR